MWLWFQRYFVSWTSVPAKVGTRFRNYSVWWCDFGFTAFRGTLHHGLSRQVKLAHDSELFSLVIWPRLVFCNQIHMSCEVGTRFRTIQPDDVTFGWGTLYHRLAGHVKSAHDSELFSLTTWLSLRYFVSWTCMPGDCLFHGRACQVIVTVADSGACCWCNTLLKDKSKVRGIFDIISVKARWEQWCRWNCDLRVINARKKAFLSY